MPSVVFWPGVGGGTEWYRCRAPGGALERQGWDVAYRSDVPADVVVFQRCGTAAQIRDLQRHAAFVVYDIDDWYDGVPAYNPAVDEVAEIIDTVHAAMRQADLITCSTFELAEGYSRLNRTVVLENYLDPAVWDDIPIVPRSKVHVGWAGHFEYRSADLDLLKPWLPGWLDQHPDVRFVAAGSKETLAYLGVDGLATPPTPDGLRFRPYDHLPYMLCNIDVGLAPLTWNRFNTAKSWCKSLEFNAAGAAAVASPSREYRRYIRPGVNGLFARPGTWGKQIETVIADLDNYKAGARKVAAEHMIDDHVHRWATAYSGAL